MRTSNNRIEVVSGGNTIDLPGVSHALSEGWAHGTESSIYQLAVRVQSHIKYVLHATAVCNKLHFFSHRCFGLAK